jgi:hypothetical protein
MSDELSELLTRWAARQRLTATQVAELRAHVLATSEVTAAFDADWLWSLLRPVTDLLEQVGGSRALRYSSTDDAVPFTQYLRLA